MSTRRSRISVRPNVGPRAPKAVATPAKDVNKTDVDSSAKEKEQSQSGSSDTTITASKRASDAAPEPQKASPKTRRQSGSQKTDVSPAPDKSSVNASSSSDTACTSTNTSKNKQVGVLNSEKNSKDADVAAFQNKKVPLARPGSKSRDTDKASHQNQLSTKNKENDLNKSEGPAVAAAPRPLTRGSGEEVLSDTNVPTEPLPGSKPPEAPRPRSRFIRPKPNLSEAGRLRVRHPSMSASDSEDDFHRQPPSVQRLASLPSLPNTPGSPGPVGQTPAFSGLVSGSAQAVANDPVQESTGKEEVQNKQPEKKVRRKREKVRTVPSDRTKMTMKDLIYYNPSPAERSEKTTARRASVDSVSSIVRDPPPSKDQVLESLCENVPQSPAMPPKQSVKDGNEDDDDDGMALPVPQVKVGPDGSIIINEASMVIDSPARPIVETGDVVHEDGENETTYSSFRNKQKHKVWTTKETIKFYKALSIVGTDFSMMSDIIPKRTRLELKNKFKREERNNKSLIDRALRERQDFDPDLFSHSDSENEPEVANAKQAKKKAGRKRKDPDEQSNKDGNTTTSAATRNKRKKKSKKTAYEESDSADEVVEEDETNTETPEVYIKKAMKEGGTKSKQDSEEEEEEEEEEEGDEMISKICRPTKSGRVPKPVQTLHIDISRTIRKQRTQFTKQITSSGEETVGGHSTLPRAASGPLAHQKLLQTPPNVLRQGVRSPQFVSLTSPISGQGEGQINVSQLSPGQQLVFVTGSPAAAAPSNQTAGGKRFIHVFMMSPTGSLQQVQGEQGPVALSSNQGHPNNAQGNIIRHVPSPSGVHSSPLRSILASPQQHHQQQQLLHQNVVLSQGHQNGQLVSDTSLHQAGTSINLLSHPIRDASLLTGAPLIAKHACGNVPEINPSDGSSCLTELRPVGMNSLNNNEGHENVVQIPSPSQQGST